MGKHRLIQEDGTYRTGSTVPPKSHRGVIAVLLILVILLASSVTVLGMMNIRLFRMLEEDDRQTIQFSPTEPEDAKEALSQQTLGVEIPQIGIAGQDIAKLYRSYQQWPQGVYVSNVDPDGTAYRAGVCPGDILVAVNTVPVTDTKKLEEILRDCIPGMPYLLTVYRDQHQITLNLTVPGR